MDDIKKSIGLSDYKNSLISKAFSNNDVDTSVIAKQIVDNFFKGLIDEPTKNKAIDQLNNLIIKGGEGSKGGKVIGHTYTGKPIYASFEHHSERGHTKFNNPDDHVDAANAHSSARERVKERIIEKHGKDKSKVVEQMSSHPDIQHHDTQRQKHLDAYKKGIEKEKEHRDNTVKKIQSSKTREELNSIYQVVNHPAIGWSREGRRHLNDHLSLKERELAG